MAAGWESGAGRSPSGREWQPARLGPSPPESQRNLRDDVEASIWSAAGIPPSVLRPVSSADARESWRQFVFGAVLPVGRVVGEEAARVFGGDGGIDFSALAASDLQARSRAYKQLLEAGMDAAEARRICGFDDA